MEKENSKKITIIALVIIVLIIILFALLKLAISDDNTNQNSNNMSFGQFGNQDSNQDVEALSTTATSKTNRGEETYSNYTANINLDTLTVDGSHVSINDTTITIDNKGVYYFTGNAEEANIVVNANDSDDVVLVFDNASITSSKTACITGVNAKNIYINLVEGTINTFTDGKEYTDFIEDDEPDATIFSKTDLFINGKGTLVVNANYKDGITSKDELVITNSIIEVNSAYNGIKGKDCLDILNANIKVKAGNDGIKSTNDEDTSKGYMIIENSNISIAADDDGIHAETDLIFNNSDIEITESKEGIEGKLIVINSGNIEVYSDDDGINATDGNGIAVMGVGTEGVQLQINGGNIYVNADGDGLDSNASILMTGGKVVVAGAKDSGNNALDYESAFKVAGGELIAYGPNGMWTNPSNSSTINTICFNSSGNAGDIAEIKDSSGNVIATFEIDKAYGAVLYSSESLKDNESYTLYINNNEISTIKVENVINSEVTGMGNMKGGGRNKTNNSNGSLENQKEESIQN